MFNNKELLDIQVRTMQSYIPEKINFRGKETELSEKEKLATGRAIWYIVKRGYGISTAITRASGSFRVNTTKVERATRMVFPNHYFQNFQKSKNTEHIKKMSEDV